jgi:hypothetical protein
MELDLQSLIGLLNVQLYSLAGTPQPPPPIPPHLGSNTRARYWSAKIEDISGCNPLVVKGVPAYLDLRLWARCRSGEMCCVPPAPHPWATLSNPFRRRLPSAIGRRPDAAYLGRGHEQVSRQQLLFCWLRLRGKLSHWSTTTERLYSHWAIRRPTVSHWLVRWRCDVPCDYRHHRALERFQAAVHWFGLAAFPRHPLFLLRNLILSEEEKCCI